MEFIEVFSRNNELEDDNDIWDDSLLVDAYNKSVNRIKKKIACELGKVNGTDTATGGEVKFEDAAREKVLNNVENKNKWKVGDFCRSVYSVDGVAYEAKIIRLLPNGNCLVKYCGYDNEEVVKIKNLKKSEGKQRRIMQQLLANSQNENHENSDLSDNGSENVGKGEPLNFPGVHPIPGIPSVPPPPPLNVTAQFNLESESDALSALLMSWYMTGYHTGYYQAIKESKKSDKKE